MYEDRNAKTAAFAAVFATRKEERKNEKDGNKYMKKLERNGLFLLNYLMALV